MSGRLDVDELGRLIDEALRARSLKLRDLARCAGRLHPAPGRRLSVVHACLDLRLPGYDPGDSDLETRTFQVLTGRGLPAPKQQHPVRLDGKKYFIDLAYPDELVAIEVDSWEHHGRVRSAFDYDRSRANALVAHEWSVLHFTSRMSDDEIADRTESALEIARRRADVTAATKRIA